MKSFQQAAADIVHRIIETEEDSFDDDDLKDVIEIGQEDFWYQIDGDANPWVYGGSWFNPAKSEIIHFDGVEYDKDVEPEDVDLPATMLAKLPPEQPDWRDNQERDRIIDSYRLARAEFLNARKPRSFWRITVHSRDEEGIVKKYEDKIMRQFDLETGEQFKRWPLPRKMIEIGRYIGFHELGDQFTMSYKEAQTLLGSQNI